MRRVDGRICDSFVKREEKSVFLLRGFDYLLIRRPREQLVDNSIRVVSGSE